MATREPAITASLWVLEKMGMAYEGTVCEHVFDKGDFHDHRLYALLRREWPPT